MLRSVRRRFCRCSHAHARDCIYTHTHVRARTRVHTHARARTRVHTYTHTPAHVCTHTHVLAHVCTYTHVLAHLCTHTRVPPHLCTHTHTRARTCVHTHTRVLAHVCTHTHAQAPGALQVVLVEFTRECHDLMQLIRERFKVRSGMAPLSSLAQRGCVLARDGGRVCAFHTAGCFPNARAANGRLSGAPHRWWRRWTARSMFQLPICTYNCVLTYILPTYICIHWTGAPRRW